MQAGTDILIVLATLVGGIAFSSVVAGWATGTRPRAALASLTIAVGILVFVHLRTPGGLSWTDIPDAFILVAARILN
jgi:hypothetical protein